MKVYIDVIFIVNFIYDFFVFFSSSIILKRNIRIYRLIFGSLIGSLTIFMLFIRFNTFTLLVFKLLLSAVIIITSYGFKNIKYFIKNLYYFYLISIILGGFLYLINNQFSYNNGLIFFSGFKLNMFLGFILSVIGIIIYIKNIKELKLNYNKYTKAIIYFKNFKIDVNAFVDTGNKLKDPYLFRPIILVDEKIIKNKNNVLLVPYKTCNNTGLLKCIKPEKIYIDGVGYKKHFLVGLTDSIKMDGINCLLNERLMEG